MKYKQLTKLGSGGLVSEYNATELLALDSKEFKQAIYDARYLLIKNLGSLSIEQVIILNSKFGIVWNAKEYSCILEEAHEEFPGGAALGLYGYSSVPRLASGIMPYHTDVPIKLDDENASLTLPIRSLYAADITPEVGYLNIIDSMPLVKNASTDELKLWSSIELHYQSWYKPGTNFQWIPLLGTHPITKKPYLNLSTFSSTPWRNYGFRHYETWIVGMRIAGKHTYDLQAISDIMERLDISENKYTVYYEPNDFLIMDNVGLMHSRSAVIPKKNSPRKFWRANIKHDLSFNWSKNVVV